MSIRLLALCVSLILVLLVTPAHAVKLFCVVNELDRGVPEIDQTVTAYTGRLHCESVGGKGLYLISGTAAQLTAINALPAVVGIVAVTENGTTKWAELDGVIASGVRTKLNTWLTARGYPTIPAGWTYKQVVNAVFKRLNAKWDLSTEDVTE